MSHCSCEATAFLQPPSVHRTLLTRATAGAHSSLKPALSSHKWSIEKRIETLIGNPLCSPSYSDAVSRQKLFFLMIDLHVAFSAKLFAIPHYSPLIDNSVIDYGSRPTMTRLADVQFAKKINLFYLDKAKKAAILSKVRD